MVYMTGKEIDMLHITIRDDEKRINREITADFFIGSYHRVDGGDGASLIYADCDTKTIVGCLRENLDATARLQKKLWDDI